MFMCVVNLKSVNKLDLTWKQSFLILVDSELFRRRSLYQLKDFSEETEQTISTCYSRTGYNTVNIDIQVNIHSKQEGWRITTIKFSSTSTRTKQAK